MDGYAKQLARYMVAGSGQVDEDRVEIVAYALVQVLVAAGALVLMAAVGGPLGLLTPTLLAAGTGAALRMVSGGAHYATPLRCTVMSSLTYLALGWLAAVLGPGLSLQTAVALAVALLGSGAWVAARYAPAGTPNKPLAGGDRIRLRRATLFRVACCAIIVAFLLRHGRSELALAALLGFTWQMFTLTPGGYRFAALIDQMEYRVSERG